MRSIGLQMPAGFALRCIVSTLLLAWVGTAGAVEFHTGHQDLKLRWDTTLRYNLGVRAERPDGRILANPTYDESDGKFDRGDAVTNRLDILTEADLNYKGRVGARLSAAGWYDHAYEDRKVRSLLPGSVSSYLNDHYSGHVARYVNGPSGEFLDAFVWANLNAGEVPLNLKIGRQTNYFGEGLLIPAHAASYSQSPIDGVMAVTSSGVETKEVFRPESQFFVKAQLTPALSLSAQYFLDWHASRLPFGGTFFSPADPFFEGLDRLPAGPDGSALAHARSVKPAGRGNWGVSAKLNVEAIKSTLALHYREFDDYNPWFGPNLTSFVNIPGYGAVPTAYRLVYPTNIKMVGLSAARLIGPLSVGADVSLRRGGALNTDAVSPVDQQGPRGNTLHMVANSVYLLPATRFWDTGNFIAELAYSRLLKVTHHRELYKGVGTAACVSALGSAGDKSDGCSSKNYAALALLFTPQYLQVLPS